LNGEDFPAYSQELQGFIVRQQSSLIEGNTLSYVVIRKNAAGEEKNVELKAILKPIEYTNRFVIAFDDNATPEQLAVRKAWLSK
jgi:hypothetical protein